MKFYLKTLCSFVEVVFDPAELKNFLLETDLNGRNSKTVIKSLFEMIKSQLSLIEINY